MVRQIIGFTLIAGLAAGNLLAAPARPRIAVVVDSSGAMLQTPEFVTYPESCVGVNFNPCVAGGANPSPAQEQCNACVSDTVSFDTFCAGNWDADCRDQYLACLTAITGRTTCSQTLSLNDHVDTRGDGSADVAGCDLNANGQPDDSRIFKAKRSLSSVFASRADAAFALWSFRQVRGGQLCASDAACPDTPGGASVLTCESIAGQNRCAMDAANHGFSASSVGQCVRETWNGASNLFGCNQCDFVSSYERATCAAFLMDRVKTNGISPLNGSTVQCAFPTTDHRFILYHGAINNGGVCDPTGGQKIAGFPPVDTSDNTPQLLQWVNNAQPTSADEELRAHGFRPIAASLRDLRTGLLPDLSTDLASPCRPYHAIVIAGGPDECEPASAAVTAAAALQNMSFTNHDGVPVTGFDVPVHVIGFAVCPLGSPNCQTAQDLNAVAAAGGTGSAVFVATEPALLTAISQIVDASIPVELCNGVDDDCDGSTDNAAVPSSTGPLTAAVSAGNFTLSWAAASRATGYDIVRGALTTLRSTGGNFTAAVDGCAVNDLNGTSFIVNDAVPPGTGRFYLVRGVNCGGAGTYDSGAASQIGSRDAEINAAPGACP